DWNDVYRERGADAVRAAFAALPKQVEQPAEPPAEHRDVQLDDFHALMPMHKYIYVPSGDLWPAESINNRLYPVPIQGEKLKPATWLDRYRPVEQMTWVPGEPQLIVDRLFVEGGWIAKKGSRAFNLYRPPAQLPGDAGRAGPWRE